MHTDTDRHPEPERDEQTQTHTDREGHTPRDTNIHKDTHSQRNIWIYNMTTLPCRTHQSIDFVERFARHTNLFAAN